MKRWPILVLLCAAVAVAGVPNNHILVGNGSIWVPTNLSVVSVGTAADLICTDCVTLGAETTGGYAASVSEGGPATTATALAANGANCSAGSYPLGVDASGAAESCTAAAPADAPYLTNGPVAGLSAEVDITGATALTWGGDQTFNGNVGLGITPAYAFHTLLDATESLFIDGRTNPRAITLGAFRMAHTPAMVGTRPITLDVDTAGYGDTRGLTVQYTATSHTGGHSSIIAVDLDVPTTATGGELVGYHVARTGTGTAQVIGLGVHQGVDPIVQIGTGALAAPSIGFKYDGAYTDITTALGSLVTDVSLFDANNDYVYVGHTSKFTGIQVLLATLASGAGVKPTFEFSLGASAWSTYTPADGTNGFRVNGAIDWAITNGLSTWATDTVNGAGPYYWIRIRRTQVGLTTVPVEDRFYLAGASSYSWDADGDLSVASVTSAGSVRLNGATSGYVALAAAAAAGSTTYTLPAADGSVNQVLSTNGSGTLAWATAGGLTKFTEAESTTAPNATVYVDSLTAAAASTNADVAFVAKGSGATLAQVPDSTATGGNKRGIYATDWQKIRSAATQVASSSYTTIGGGRNNTASASDATVGGGVSNNAANNAATVGGGSSNIALGNYSTVGGGYIGTANGQGTTVAGGQQNTTNDSYGTVGGGYLNNAGGNSTTIPGGRNGTTRNLYGRFSYASGQFGTGGDAQMGIHVTRRSTTDATVTRLTADAGAPSTSNVNVLPNAHAYAVRAEVVARQNTTGDAKSWSITALVKRGASAAATALVGAPTVTVVGADAGAAAWTATVVADTTRGSIEIEVVGEAGKTIRWVGTMYTVEVGG